MASHRPHRSPPTGPPGPAARARAGLTADAERVYAAAVAGALPGALLAGGRWPGLAARPLAEYGRIAVVGAGKAALAMAGAVEPVLAACCGAGGRGARWSGEVVVPQGYLAVPAAPLPRGVHAPTALAVRTAGHPAPDADGQAAARHALEAAAACGAGDLLLVLLSGGASALWPALAPGVSLANARRTTALLLESGAPIAEVNAVRKHLSAIGGGRLAASAAPADVLALVISDVVGDDLAVIGGGPTVADPDTFAKAADVLRARGLWDRVPDGVRAHLAYGLAGQVTETIKPGASALARARTHVVGSVRDALSAARAEAERLGYAATVVSDRLTGEARAVGAAVTQALVDAAESADAAAGPRALLWGGETTVTVRGAGVGGRNQELALAAAMALDAWRHDRPAAAARFDAAVLSGGTDGVDGPTDAAGAVVTPRTVADAAARGLDARVALAANDSHPLLDAAGALLRPGPTHTNVMDVQIALLRPRGPE